ncbi:hypothetical protein GALL_497680 [mine drainage metagenome]|uniref:Uncharacterized protein n=1 Tax=mine drainage metagenome TaxID=410659 RepID=A0A1J5PBE8_9ZZZZ
MRRKNRHHFKAFNIGPGVECEVPNGEKIGETFLFNPEQGGHFFGHRGTHHRRSKVIDAVPGAHQHGQPGKMVVMCMGVKNAVNLINADAQRRHDMCQLGSGIDQIDPPLVGENA